MPGLRGVFQCETFMQTSRGDGRLRVFPSMECPGSVDKSKERIQASKYLFFIAFFHRFGRGLLYQIKMLICNLGLCFWSHFFLVLHCCGKISSILTVEGFCAWWAFQTSFRLILSHFEVLSWIPWAKMSTNGVARCVCSPRSCGRWWTWRRRSEGCWNLAHLVQHTWLTGACNWKNTWNLKYQFQEVLQPRFICFKKMLFCQRRDLAALARVAPPNEVPAWSVLVAGAWFQSEISKTWKIESQKFHFKSLLYHANAYQVLWHFDPSFLIRQKIFRTGGLPCFVATLFELCQPWCSRLGFTRSRGQFCRCSDQMSMRKQLWVVNDHL